MKATQIAVSAFGAVVTFAGIEHGVGEMLQGPVAPTGPVIESWPDTDAFAVLAGEPAMMVIPNLLMTGVLAVLVALAAHGVAHAIALSGLVGQSVGGVSTSHTSVRSWLLPGLGASATASVLAPFWLLATAGFLLAALSFWEFVMPHAPWRQIAVASAVASIIGIVLSAGTWPGSPNELRSMLNVGIALTMDAAILVALLWLHWPTQAGSRG